MTSKDQKRETQARDEAASRPSRRGFLGKIWAALAAVAILEYGWLAASFLRPRRRAERKDFSTLTVAGPVDRFEPGSVTAFPQGKFYLARLEDGSFLAVSRRCTHLGCTVPWDAEQGRFVCPCHASSFDIRGEVLSPPAPRALDLFEVRIENEIVKVDVSRAIRRASFSEEQAVRP